ncbi:MAG: hypothetical protein NVS2B3_01130 [Vulcanimicrobiaceae bacterium]
MADGVKTGNAFLDAWTNALAPLTTSTSSWAGNFFGTAFPSPETVFAGAPLDLPMQVWKELGERSLGALSALNAGANVGNSLGEALESSFSVIGDVGGAAVEGPTLLAEAAKASSVLCVARESYRAFMVATWQRAYEEIVREAARRAGEGEPVATSEQWLSLSNAVADRVFVGAFHSEPYVEAQRRLASALADQRRSEANVVEFFARFGHFPTRRALDEVGKEISELRRRVRRLERARRATSAKRTPKVGAADGV